jgi:hypothetical protein
VASSSSVKPVFYHCIPQVVDRRFAFAGEEKENFRTFMRMYENFPAAGWCLTA